MPKAQCYYEILGIEPTASGDDIKRSYRNLALVWHPDKNRDNPEEAHAKFQIILKAYETLSDPRERDWYDRHKDQILSGRDNDGECQEEKCLNLFQYFSSDCYANFDDSEDGFYTVYRKVFETITQEETDSLEQLNKVANKKRNCPDDRQYPNFGKSDSDYDNVVRPFYAVWSGFCTNMTFDHLDKYKTTEAENRRILRAMEKENKKLKDQARKERNQNVRNLVEFIKKRDKRLKAHKLLVDQQNELNRQKTAEKQRLQREKAQQESLNYKPSAWDDMQDIEDQLQQLEEELDDDKFSKRKRKTQKSRAKDSVFESHDANDASESIPCDNNVDDPIDVVDVNNLSDNHENDDDSADEEEFYCPACNKAFKSIKAFENHESSKKHKQNVSKLMSKLKEDEKKLAK